MVESTGPSNRITRILTIAAAVDLLAGIVLLGIGFFEGNTVLFYVGTALILSGIGVQMLSGLLGRTHTS
jgi:uncharacterized membrane protein HdeD (DUF308 family)